MTTQATLASLGWLRKVLEVFKTVRARILRRAVKVKRYIQDLVRLEETTGNETEAWAKINAAGLTGDGVSLTAAEVQYIREFKGLWDKYFKKHVQVAAAVIGDVDTTVDDILADEEED